MKFVWNSIYKCAFNNLKQQFIIMSILTYFNLNLEYILETDSFDHAQKDVLSQYNKNNILWSIIFFYENSMLQNQITKYIIRNCLQ